MHECMVRLCILLNSLLYICKSELRKSQSGIKGFFFATVARRAARCVARMGSQTARAPMHEIECVERLALDSLMREMLSS